jgi:hypothetical protein
VKERVFTLVVFAGLTVWAAVAHWRAVPGFACMALGQACFLFALLESQRGRERPQLVWAYFALWSLGLALLFAAVVGPLTSGRFWIVFAAVAFVMFPAVFLARRLFVRD